MSKNRTTAAVVSSSVVIAALGALLLIPPSQDFNAGREAQLEPPPVKGTIFTVPGRVTPLRRDVEYVAGMTVSELPNAARFADMDFYVNADTDYGKVLITGYEFMQLNRILTAKLGKRKDTPLPHADTEAWSKIIDKEIKMRGGLQLTDITETNLIDKINQAVQR